ncbi:complement C2-like [Siphateles boraxobius]|uniref:complement C2-like n=1 Tax=Siphateles boraxobius TaxID=180520 RepID=UPI00406441C0
MTARLLAQRTFQKGSIIPLKTFQRILGCMASAAAVLQLGLLRMRPLQRWLNARVSRRAWAAGCEQIRTCLCLDCVVTKCGLAQEQDDQDEQEKTTYTRPWHVNVCWRAEKCKGSLVTKSMVLTAAHCFIKVNTDESVSFASADDITVHHGIGEVKAMELILHPLFNLRGLKDKNVKEFYDYDIALVRMRENITISLMARPIYLPCTKSSNRALRMDLDSTCDEHKRSLLHLEETPAHFIRQGTRRSDTHIHSGAKVSAVLTKLEHFNMCCAFIR